MNRYIFHDTGSPHTINRPRGPYYTHWVDLIGNKLVYTRDDIEKFANTLSSTLKQRVLKMREGTCIRIASTGRCSNLSLKRLTESESKDLDAYIKLKEALSEVVADIRKSCPDLFLKKSMLEKQIRELKRGISFDVV